VALARLNRPAPGVRQFCPGIPEALAKVVEKALEREPSQRHAAIASFLEQICELSTSLGPALDRIYPVTRPGKAGLVADTWDLPAMEGPPAEAPWVLDPTCASAGSGRAGFTRPAAAAEAAARPGFTGTGASGSGSRRRAVGSASSDREGRPDTAPPEASGLKRVGMIAVAVCVIAAGWAGIRSYLSPDTLRPSPAASAVAPGESSQSSAPPDTTPSRAPEREPTPFAEETPVTRTVPTPENPIRTEPAPTPESAEPTRTDPVAATGSASPVPSPDTVGPPASPSPSNSGSAAPPEGPPSPVPAADRNQLDLAAREERVQGDAARARATLEGALAARPESSAIAAALTRFYLVRGSTGDAKLPEGSPPKQHIKYLTEFTPPADPETQILEQLVQGQLEPARATASRLFASKANAHFPAALAFLALEPEKPQWLPRVRATLLSSPSPWTDWSLAAAELTDPRSASQMETLLKELQETDQESGMPLLLRALWLSRQGELTGSLDVLEQARRQHLDYAVAPAMIAEILTRPLWLLALGQPVPKGIDQTCRAAADPDLPVDATPYAKACVNYLQLVRQGRFYDLDTLLTQLWNQAPQEPFWSLAALWRARLRQDTAGIRYWLPRIVLACRAQGRGVWLLLQIKNLGGSVQELMKPNPVH
jgi:hypothetical protein